MLTPKKFLLIRSMQVRDNHFYQKLSVMLIYNKLMTSSVMTSFYDHVILIKNDKIDLLTVGS